MLSSSEYPQRFWKTEGYLGRFMERGSSQHLGAIPEELNRDREDSDVYNKTHLMTFFSVLPMPDYYFHRSGLGGGESPVSYSRALGRQADLTALLPLRRLIVLGYLKGSPLPLPLKVDGRDVPIDPAHSWTMVRMIVPVE